MNLELYFAPGACSFVPHSGLEAIKAATGQDFTPKLVKLHKGEQKTPEYLQMNPDGQVPVLLADGKPLTQIVAIADFLDRSFPQGRVAADRAMEARAGALAARLDEQHAAHHLHARLLPGALRRERRQARPR